MISVEEALTFDRVKEASTLPREAISVTEDESVVLDYLEATVESGIFKDFKGEVFDIRIPVKFANETIVAALKQRAEAAGWLVGVFNVLDDAGDRAAFQVVFAPGGKPLVAPGEKRLQLVEPARDHTPRAVRTKPTALLVSDVPGWAFDQNMRDMASYLADEFDFGFFYTENWFKGERPDWDKYDVIYEAYHRNPPMGIPMSRALGAMRSQWFKPEKPLPPDAEDVALVNSYRAFQLSAKRNYDELVGRCPNVVYLTNPVDTRRFTSTPKRAEIVASWNGNARHKAMDGRFIKGFYDIAVPACQRAKIPLVAAEYGTKDGPMRRRAPAEMPAFYHQANVALCTSEYESASNSVMESMSSGLALIATDVGNHRELRDAQIAAFGDSGIVIVERSIDAFVEALRGLTPERAREMGGLNRREIEERWSWSLFAPKYSSFLRMAL